MTAKNAFLFCIVFFSFSTFGSYGDLSPKRFIVKFKGQDQADTLHLSQASHSSAQKLEDLRTETFLQKLRSKSLRANNFVVQQTQDVQIVSEHGQTLVLEAYSSQMVETLKDMIDSPQRGGEFVEYIEEDRIFRHTWSREQNHMSSGYLKEDAAEVYEGYFRDQRFFEQWSLHSEAGIQIIDAWDLTKGSSDVVVAILDTGITHHSDLNQRLLPGADLIWETRTSRKPNGRSHEATDPGDWVDVGDSCYDGYFIPSSWHGTHVAGIVGAQTGNGIGIAGVDWRARILPVRVLGTCGGYVSDIADGIRWAVGLEVEGLMSNPNPADVINLSLGGPGSCGQTMQNAIDQANQAGAVVVVASGNQGDDLDINEYSPANCHGVITVASSDKNGLMTSYSNYGESVDVVAPGGLGGSGRGVLSTLNYGQRSPDREGYAYYSGTSMASPHVAGVVSLIKSVNPDLYPAQIREIIRQSARELTFSECGDMNCYSGRLDAFEAISMALTYESDPDFRGSEPVRPGDSNLDEDGARRFQNSQNSGGCGTIVDISSLPPGPGGSAGAFAFGFFLLFLMVQAVFVEKTRLVRVGHSVKVMGI